jgi:diguanylate cyclase (GGDEF)-like protein
MTLHTLLLWFFVSTWSTLAVAQDAASAPDSQPASSQPTNPQPTAPQQISTLVTAADSAIAQTNYSLASQKLTEAYHLAQTINDPALERTVVNSLASLYYSNEQFALAKQHYEKLVAYDLASGDDAALEVTYYNLGHVEASLQQFAEAGQLFKQSLALAEKLTDSSGIAYANKALGVNAQAINDLAMAESYLEAALAQFLTLRDETQWAAVLRNLADVELAKGETQQAINHYREVIPTLTNLRFTSALIRTYRGLSEAYAVAGSYKQAFLMQRSYADLLKLELEQQSQDSTVNTREKLDLDQYIANNEKLEEAKVQREIQLAQSQNLVRMQYLALALGAAFLVLLAIMVLRSNYMARKMQTLATTDELTKLLNRRAILQTFEQEWQRATRYNNPLTCLIFDVDHFKSINDTFGHAKGDEVLKAIAAVLNSVMRKTDHLGRIGGEEFLLVAAETDIPQAQLLAERLRTLVSELVIADINDRKITISIGIAAIQNDMSCNHTIQLADKALYHAKRTGRNRSTVYDPSFEKLQTAKQPTEEQPATEVQAAPVAIPQGQLVAA